MHTTLPTLWSHPTPIRLKYGDHIELVMTPQCASFVIVKTSVGGRDGFVLLRT
jgi:hypothetical protein